MSDLDTDPLIRQGSTHDMQNFEATCSWPWMLNIFWEPNKFFGWILHLWTLLTWRPTPFLLTKLNMFSNICKSCFITGCQHIYKIILILDNCTVLHCAQMLIVYCLSIIAKSHWCNEQFFPPPYVCGELAVYLTRAAFKISTFGQEAMLMVALW